MKKPIPDRNTLQDELDYAYLNGNGGIIEIVMQVLDQYIDFPKAEPIRGSRVRVVGGFSKGSRGVVEFVEPVDRPERKYWVLRDGSSSPVFYHKHELELE